MADHTIIPPVSGSRAIPKSRSVPAKTDKRKEKPRQQMPDGQRNKNDDGPSTIDEYA